MTIHNLPHHITTFVGRQQDIADVTALLNTPDCRLLTLVGPGGIGKTRLAIQVAGQQPFLDIVYFVPFQPLTSSDLMASAIADVVGIQLYAGTTIKQQLLNYLRDQTLLLLLDNFEHLMDGTELVSEILRTAPEVRILITSRERLNLLEEWVFDVRELKYPPNDTETDIETYDSVQLFLQHAQRVHMGFTLTPVEKPALIRICRLVEGLPLAIELAASWVRALSCDAIADEIERSLDILETSTRNVDPRHRTMRAVFEPTWMRLEKDDQKVFQQLSIFRGGFTREAAISVAKASLSRLVSFVDKALLRSDTGERYYLHELLRQYAQERLEQNVADENQAYDAHTEYYVRFLQQRAEDVTGKRQQVVLQEIATERENVRQAWLWAIQQVQLSYIERAAYTLYEFYDLQGRYREGSDLFEQAIIHLESVKNNTSVDRTLALLFTLIGWLYIRLGQYESARLAFSRSHHVFSNLNVTPPLGFGTEPLTGLGLLSTVLGDYAEAKRLSEIALEQTSARGDKQNAMIALYVLASAAFAQGDYGFAQKNAQRAYLLTNETKNQWMMAYVLIVLGDVARAKGKYQQAQQHYREGYGIQRELNNPEGMAAALVNLGGIAWLQQDMPQSEAFYQESYEIYHDINDPGGQVKSLVGLGDTMLVLGEYERSRSYFFPALKIATDIQSAPLLLILLAAIGELIFQMGWIAVAVEVSTLVIQNPSTDRLTKIRAERTLTSAQAKLSSQALVRAAERAHTDDLYAVARSLEISLVSSNLTTSIPSQDILPTRSEDALLDSLSTRELEILRLIAQGLTNREIAEVLTLEVGTVKAHNHHIFSKLDVSNRVQALTRARDLGLL